jgi:hypothetical protein
MCFSALVVLGGGGGGGGGTVFCCATAIPEHNKRMNPEIIPVAINRFIMLFI